MGTIREDAETAHQKVVDQMPDVSVEKLADKQFIQANPIAQLLLTIALIGRNGLKASSRSKQLTPERLQALLDTATATQIGQFLSSTSDQLMAPIIQFVKSHEKEIRETINELNFKRDAAKASNDALMVLPESRAEVGRFSRFGFGPSDSSTETQIVLMVGYLDGSAPPISVSPDEIRQLLTYADSGKGAKPIADFVAKHRQRLEEMMGIEKSQLIGAFEMRQDGGSGIGGLKPEAFKRPKEILPDIKMAARKVLDAIPASEDRKAAAQWLDPKANHEPFRLVPGMAEDMGDDPAAHAAVNDEQNADMERKYGPSVRAMDTLGKMAWSHLSRPIYPSEIIELLAYPEINDPSVERLAPIVHFVGTFRETLERMQSNLVELPMTSQLMAR